MAKLKKFSILTLALVCLLSLSTIVLAANPSRIRSTKGIEESSTASTLGLSGGTWVYGVRLYADASNSFATIYDATTYDAKTVAEAVDELGEATQYETVTVWYPKPIYFENGVSIYIATGVAYIFYGPEPKEAY